MVCSGSTSALTSIKRLFKKKMNELMSITYLAMMFYFSAFLSRTQYSPDGLRIHLNPDQDKALAKKMNE